MKKYCSVFFLFIFILISCEQSRTTPENALEIYLNKHDNSYAWVVADSIELADVRAYSLTLTSQKWKNYTWKHELVVFIPKALKNDGAFMYITAGNLTNGMPNRITLEDEAAGHLKSMAIENGAVTAILHQVPNQPLFDDLVEDALISYTLHEFKKTNDYTWPLLFPMVKSTTKAMDAIQEFVDKKADFQPQKFVLAGASKRGWTAWLSAATGDSRVTAIAPMVIDMLNMPATLEYQRQLYGEYSEQINDYVELEIPQAMSSDMGAAMVKMIDPYSYRNRLSVPKLLVMGTNDPYWTIDAVKLYINDIPGRNMIHYIPNVGHELGDRKQAYNLLNVFFSLILNRSDLPNIEWNIKENKDKIYFNAKSANVMPTRAQIWRATSSTRDFRQSVWTSADLEILNKTPITTHAELDYPQSGYEAFYINFSYVSPHGIDYTLSTRTFVMDSTKVFLH